ncbi:MAG TPA: hypothetical protein VMX35_14775 [Acidobacteriota bacterium]|nr:hypothetical protein [Acidobacteriota bacterium]
MGDPLSVRHVIASSDYSERIQKTEAVQGQVVRERFDQELQKQEELRRSQVIESDESEEARIREEERERRRKEAKESTEDEESSEEPPADETAESGDHLIDVKV